MLKIPSPARFAALAKQLTITNQLTKVSTPFVLNQEQIELANQILVAKVPKAIVLKSRQIGTSTFFCLLNVIVAVVNTNIRVAIVADTQQKATELLERCKDFLHQLGVELTSENTRRVRLKNLSEIHAITATGGADGTESKVGRSMSFQWLHLTELPYWPNQAAYSSLLATSSGAPVIIETTAKGIGDLFHKLWITNNDYKKIFFSVEKHKNYQSTEPITEEDWQLAQSFGFTSKSHAVYWLSELANKGGDLIGHLHDFPVIADHAFLVSNSRWMRATPPLLDYKLLDQIKIFEQKQEQNKYCIGVDTSGGVGKDSNAIAVLNATTGRLVATWTDSTATIDTIIVKLKTLVKLYPVEVIVIESNGIGQATVQAAKKAGLPVLEVVTTEASKYKGLLLVKQAIECGRMAGPEELIEESISLHTDTKGAFRGRKDLCMAISFALTRITESPYQIPAIINTQDVYTPPVVGTAGNWY